MDIDLAEYQRATGKVYDACALADELMRRYDPCPPRIVLNARLVIARASVSMGEYQEAVRQCREMVNVCLTLGQMGSGTDLPTVPGPGPRSRRALPRKR